MTPVSLGVTGLMAFGGTQPDLRRIAAKLAGPGGVAAFDAEIREAESAVFPDALSPEDAQSLFDLVRLEAALCGPGAAVAQADIFSGGHLVRLSDIHHRSGRSPAAVAAEHLAKGATLRFRDIERFDPGLAGLAGAVAETFAAPVQINVYLTPPHQEGFPPHFDNTDVFIVQVAGSKQWTLHTDYTNKAPLPDPDIPWDPERYKPIGPGETHTLQVGDVLYVPRGGMHSARCTDTESMHLTFSLAPLSMAALLEREIRRLAAGEAALRCRVPWSTGGGPEEAETVRQALRQWLDVLAERIDPAGMIAEERERLLQQAPQGSGAIRKMMASLTWEARKGGAQ